FHFRVLALHRGEVQVSRAGTGGHRRSGTAAEADEHGRAAEHDQLGTDGNLALLYVVLADVTETASEHDRLVVATYFLTARAAGRLFEGAEVAVERRAPELVVERGAAQRAFDHDVQRADDTLGLAVGLFPRLEEI